MKPERMQIPFRDWTMLQEGDRAGEFEGTALLFDHPVPMGFFGQTDMVFRRGAFAETIKSDLSRMKVLWQHDDSRPIGRPTSITETADGLKITAKISDTPDGRMARTLIADGVVTELSATVDELKGDHTEATDKKRGSLEVTSARLWEVSPVTWGRMGPGASVSEVFSQSNPADLFRAIPEAIERLSVDPSDPRLSALIDALLKLRGDSEVQELMSELTAAGDGLMCALAEE